MEEVFAISTFKNNIQKLTARPEDGCTSCKNDICAYLQDKSFAELWEIGFLKGLPLLRINKILIGNSAQHLIAEDGWRIIILCDYLFRKITLLHIYPKLGKHNKDNVTERELIDLLTEYIHERGKEKITVHRLENLLGEI